MSFLHDTLDQTFHHTVIILYVGSDIKLILQWYVLWLCVYKFVDHNSTMKKSDRQRAADMTGRVERQRAQPSSRRLVAKAHVHQGDAQFGTAAGKQCTCNVLMFMVLAKEKAVDNWNTEDMDRLLDYGTELYSMLQIHTTEDYLLIDELPEYIQWNDCTYRKTVEGTYGGSLSMMTSNIDGQQFSLDDALHQASLLQTLMYVTIGSVTPSYTVGLLRQGTAFYLFDSHSRDSKGLCCASGEAVLLTFTTLHDVAAHLRELARSLGIPHDAFEVVPVTVTKLDDDLNMDLSDMTAAPDEQQPPDSPQGMNTISPQ